MSVLDIVMVMTIILLFNHKKIIKWLNKGTSAEEAHVEFRKSTLKQFKEYKRKQRVTHEN